MVPIIGSGKFVTTPIVANDGKLMEESKNDSMRDNGSMPTSSLNSDKKVIQWKLSLHQIGIHMFSNSISFFIFNFFFFVCYVYNLTDGIWHCRSRCCSHRSSTCLL